MIRSFLPSVNPKTDTVATKPKNHERDNRVLRTTNRNSIHNPALYLRLETLQPRLRALKHPASIPDCIKLLTQTRQHRIPILGSHMPLQIHDGAILDDFLNEIRIALVGFEAGTRAAGAAAGALVADRAPHADFEEHDAKAVHVE